MKYKINYPTDISKLNVVDDNVDVCVTCDNGKQYTFVVATIKNIEKLLEEGVIDPNTKLLIVDELTNEKISKVISLTMKDERICSFYGEDL